jgi:hypothetical protein
MLQMKNILLVLAAISSASALKVKEGGSEAVGLTVELMGKWKLWTDAHGKTYESHEKKMERLQVWLDNNGTYPIVVIVVFIVQMRVYLLCFLATTARHHKKTAGRVSRGRCTGISQVTRHGISYCTY